MVPIKLNNVLICSFPKTVLMIASDVFAASLADDGGSALELTGCGKGTLSLALDLINPTKYVATEMRKSDGQGLCAGDVQKLFDFGHK